MDSPLILAVDDQKSNLDILVDMLAENYDVSVALDGVTALEIAREDAPDLILLDIVMPEMDGFAVLAELKASPETASIPVIMVSSNDTPEEKAKGLKAGARAYLTKPLERSLLLNTIKVHLT
jgi:putative two-component system response regulator